MQLPLTPPVTKGLAPISLASHLCSTIFELRVSLPQALLAPVGVCQDVAEHLGAHKRTVQVAGCILAQQEPAGKRLASRVAGQVTD